ncbi:phage tail protein [Marinomonas fungiae]|uniref:phage tail-collar fiber domain-containing protein n=1 Tax=Marinomonas fungiae TaxID=1137284 RepID=UPI003A94D15A
MAIETEGTITRVGAAYLSTRISQMAKVNVTHFVLANVPGVDETTEADWDFELAAEYVVSEQPIYRLSHTGESSVVYSMVMDSKVGDFDFNWYGLVTDTGEVMAFAHIPMVSKRSNVGQIINRNFLLPFTAAKALTGAEIPAESWQFDFTDTIAEVTVSLSGPRSIYAGDSYTYTFTDWDDFSDYSASVDVGTATLGRATLNVSIPSNTTAEQCLITLIRNGSTRIIPIRIGDPIVAPPTLISPVNNAPNIVEQPTLTASSFKTFPSNVDSHVSTDWELYDANNNLVYSSYNNTTNKTSLKLGVGVLRDGGRGYKWRVRYKGASLGLSEWSGYYSFTTTDVFLKDGVVMQNGDIVVTKIGGYWYLLSPENKWKQEVFSAGSFFVSSLGGTGDGGSSDSVSGSLRTTTKLNEGSAQNLKAMSYCRSLGNDYFLASRYEMRQIVLKAEFLYGKGFRKLKNLGDGVGYSGTQFIHSSTEGVYSYQCWTVRPDMYAGNQADLYSTYQKRKDESHWVIPMRRIPV